MKIGIIASYFYPATGGAENLILRQAKALAKKHEVHVFTTDRKGEEVFEKEEILENIHIHRSKTLFRYKYYFLCYPGLITNLLKYDLDILHVHSMGFLQHDIAVLIKKIINPNLKLVCTPYEIPMALGNYNLLEKTLQKIYMYWAIFMNTFYDVFIQLNPYSYETLKDFGVEKNKLKLVPGAVDEEIFSPSDKKIKSSLIKKYNLKNKIVISYLGRIQEYKGLDQIIKVLPEAKKSKDVIFVGIGDDTGDKDRLKNLAKSLGVEKNIIFTGRVSEEEKKALLEISDIFIFPSREESFGIALLEAMAKGNAAISTKTHGGRYLIKKENGFLYSFGNTNDLKRKLISLLDNEKIRERIQRENIKKAKTLTWEKVNNTLIDIYEKLLDNEK